MLSWIKPPTAFAPSFVEAVSLPPSTPVDKDAVMFVRKVRRRRSDTFPQQERVMTGARSIIAAGLLITLGAVVGTGGSASAGPAFDGMWSVVVAAESGSCSGAYRYPVAIVNGRVRHADPGDQVFSIRGRVATGGRVNVEVSRGDLRAYGIGRLSAAGGGGTWHSPNGCAGRWQAARRR